MILRGPVLLAFVAKALCELCGERRDWRAQHLTSLERRVDIVLFQEEVEMAIVFRAGTERRLFAGGRRIDHIRRSLGGCRWRRCGRKGFVKGLNERSRDAADRITESYGALLLEHFLSGQVGCFSSLCLCQSVWILMSSSLLDRGRLIFCRRRERPQLPRSGCRANFSFRQWTSYRLSNITYGLMPAWTRQSAP